MPLRATMADFRQMHERGFAEVRRMLAEKRCTEVEAEAAFKDYRFILGIIDSMTPAEKENPLEAVDSESIKRIALSAGATDQNVIRFLINWSGYSEEIARVNFDERREAG